MALHIDRKRGESVVFAMPDGRSITVTFIKANDRRVSMAITADQDIIISRGEHVRTVEDRLKEVIGQS